MKEITAAEAAKKWGISPARVGMLARSGRISGARHLGRIWLIPEDAEKPSDARRIEKQVEGEKKKDLRYPFIVCMSRQQIEADLYGSEEEKQLIEAELMINRLEFESAGPIIQALIRKSNDNEIRLFAAFCDCLISCYEMNLFAMRQSYELFVKMASYYEEKMEIGYLKVMLDALVIGMDSLIDGNKSYSEYEFDPAFLPVLYAAEAYGNCMRGVLCGNAEKVNTIELTCQFLKAGGYEMAEQIVHVALMYYYLSNLNKKTAMQHLRRVLTIAYEQKFYLFPCMQYSYCNKEFDEILEEFPQDFGKMLRMLAVDYNKHLQRTVKKGNQPTELLKLSSEDLELIRYALKGMSNETIAGLLFLSKAAVARHYSRLYEVFGVDSKKELAERYRKMLVNYGNAGMNQEE